MKILKNIKVPTGNILIVDGDNGELEMLSLGDYGKGINVKADFLGLKRIPKQVRHTKLLPLTTKWVITISTQYGCRMGCPICDVPLIPFGGNATFNDLIKQVLTGIKLHPEVQCTNRLNIHFARMGEPTFNPDVLDATKWLKTHIDPEYRIHPVVSTIMPKNNIWLKTFIHTWMRIKNRLLRGNAGLQISINATNPEDRIIAFNNQALSLEQISKLMEGIIPNGRKITLNFAICDWKLDPFIIRKYFDPDNYLIKLTPMHKTHTARKNAIETKGDYTTYYPFKRIEYDFKTVGYDVIVFIASIEEDLGRITCGNVILSGSKPEVTHEILK